MQYILPQWLLTLLTGEINASTDNSLPTIYRVQHKPKPMNSISLVLVESTSTFLTLKKQIIILRELRVRTGKSRHKRNVERVRTSKIIVELVICGFELAFDGPEMTIGVETCKWEERTRVDDSIGLDGLSIGILKKAGLQISYTIPTHYLLSRLAAVIPGKICDADVYIDDTDLSLCCSTPCTRLI